MSKPYAKYREIEKAIISQNIPLIQSFLSYEENIIYLDWDEERYIYQSVLDLNEEQLESVILLELAVIVENLEIVKILLEKCQNLPNWQTCLSAALQEAASSN